MTSLLDLKNAWQNSRIPAGDNAPKIPEWLSMETESGKLLNEEFQRIYLRHPRKLINRYDEDQTNGIPYPENWRSTVLATDESERQEDSLRDWIPRLSDEEHNEISNSIKHAGIEALAWYEPFHFDSNGWGIYIRETGVTFLADFIESKLGYRPDSIQYSLLFLYYHELCHGLVEAVLTYQELLTHHSSYGQRDFTCSAQLPVQLSFAELEEALANATALRSRYPRDIRNLFSQFSQNQPRGYSDWSIARSPRDYSKTAESFYDTCATQAGLQQTPWMPLHSWARSVSFDFPVFLVKDARPNKGILFAIPFGENRVIVHTSSEHPPPHFEVGLSTPTWHEGRYRYPFENSGIPPYDPVDPTKMHLNGSDEKLVHEAIEGSKDKFLSNMKKQIVNLKKKYPLDHRLVNYDNDGNYIG